MTVASTGLDLRTLSSASPSSDTDLMIIKTSGFPSPQAMQLRFALLLSSADEVYVECIDVEISGHLWIPKDSLELQTPFPNPNYKGEWCRWQLVGWLSQLSEADAPRLGPFLLRYKAVLASLKR